MDELDLRPVKLYLLKNYSFFYSLLQLCKITLDDKQPYIAAVKVQNRIEMVINPTLFSKLPMEEQAGIILHEFGHIYKDHIKQTKEGLLDSISAKMGIETQMQMANIAMDLEINPYIEELVKSKLMGPDVKKAEMQPVYPKHFDFTTGDSWINYYAQLKSKAKVQNSSHQDHEYFKDSTNNKDLMKEAVANATKKAKTLSAGELPKDVKDFMFQYEASKQIPWQQVLRQFTQSLIDVNTLNTWKRPSRRFGSKIPGIKKIPKTEILIGIDSSGSVSDDDLKAFYSEIEAINSTGNIDIEIAVFDTNVHQRAKYVKGFEASRLCQGGTSFIAVHDIAIEERFKGVIYLTDGYAEFPDAKEVTYKCLWVINNDSVKPPYGSLVRIKSSNE